MKSPVKIYLQFLFLIFLALNSFARSAASKYPLDYLEHGEEAYQKKDYAAFLADARKAYKIAPTYPPILYALARASALLGNRDDALSWLNKAVVIGGIDTLNAAGDSDLASIKNTPEFQSVLSKIDRMKTPVQRSLAAFTIPEKDLVPEGTAYDPVTGNLFIGSIYKQKIISIDQSGAIKNFIDEKQNGILAVLGLKVDAKRRVLWAVSASRDAGGNLLGATDEDKWKTGMFKYDLSTGKLLKKYPLPGKTEEHCFNDLAVSSKGDIYITDTSAGAVYKISHEKDTLELFIKPAPDLRRFHNGIAITPDDKYLFVAHELGIDIVNLNSGKRSVLTHPGNITLAGVDGLSFYRNSLIAHQASTLRSINRYYLGKDLRRVKKKEVIDAYRPEFSSPTTGALAGDSYYYIANAQLRSFTDGKLWPAERLKNIIILKAKL